MATGTAARDGERNPKGGNAESVCVDRETSDVVRFRHLSRLRRVISDGGYDIDSGLVADSILRTVGRIA